MNKTLIEVAKDTLDIVNNGSYNLLGLDIKLNNVEKGVLYTPNELDVIDESVFKVFSNTTIDVVNEGTVDAIFRIKDNRLGVLNFASARHPGGGFMHGAAAQEECLAFCSNLYDSLKGNAFYNKHEKIRTKMYSDNMIFGSVEFFKSSDYSLVFKPRTVRVLTSAAVNMNQVLIQGENIELAKEVMKNRMRKILRLFAYEGCETIVLGAFGCGVFGNNPEDVATNWVDLLEDEGYYKHFKHIVFSIYDRDSNKTNFNTFKNIILRA